MLLVVHIAATVRRKNFLLVVENVLQYAANKSCTKGFSLLHYCKEGDDVSLRICLQQNINPRDCTDLVMFISRVLSDVFI